MKDNMHLDKAKHPFQSGPWKGTSPSAKSGAAHPTAAGKVGPGKSANAAMKGK